MNDQIKSQEQSDVPPPTLAAQANARLMGRRRLAKFALGTPVLMTLASRPVLAGQCLSNMMSGNTSPGHDQGHCSKGWSPGGWGQPGGQVYTYTTTGAWAAINLVYGSFSPSNCPGVNHPKETRYECYGGGSTLMNVPGALNKGGLPGTTELVDVLCDPKLDNLTRLLVCAYMNALLSAKNVGFTYILTTQQVLDLATGVILPPPGYTDLMTFLSSTWN
jgi:hypothetical protein